MDPVAAKRLDDLYRNYLSESSPDEILVDGLRSIDVEEYKEITRHAKWLKEFIGMVENLPISVSVASRKSRKGVSHPLIYVNKQFERTTKYSRREIMGKNCRFLQGPLSEASASRALRETLSLGGSCKVLITNYRKDGSSFRNLLSMFPIKYSDEVCYYVGIQTDLTDPSTPYNYIMLVDDLSKIIVPVIDGDQRVRPKFQEIIEKCGC